MAGARIIGRVGVRLIPDLTGFYRDAKRELDKVEARLPKLKIGVELDANRLKTEALKTIRDVNREITGQDRYKIKLGAKIEARKADIREAMRELNALAKGERVDFGATVATALAELDVDADSLKLARKKLEDWRDDVSPLKVAVLPDVTNGKATAVGARLAVLTRPREVEIIPKLNGSAAAGVVTALAALSGARVLNDMLDGLWSRLKRLDQAVPIIGTLAEASAGLSAALLASASNLFTLAQGLAQIGPAALVLPGIFGGIAFGLGTMVAALKDFNQVFPDFSSKLGKLQDSISSSFWERAEASMRRMIDTLFPLFTRELTQTGAELGGFFGRLADSLRSVLGPALGSMFTDLHESIRIASGYTDDFVRVIAVLGRVGAGYLPRLAEYFGQISQRFADFLSSAEADGRLAVWIDRAIFNLKELGRIIGNLGGIFAGIAQAAEAAGGSTLTSFGNLLQGMEDAVKSASFQRVLTDVFKASHEAMDALINIAGPAFKGFVEGLGETAAAVFPVMGRTIGTALDAIFDALNQPEVWAGAMALFDGLNDAVISLAPAMEPLGKAFGALLEIVGKLAEVLGPIIGEALIIISDLFVQMQDPITQVIELLGGALLTLLETVGPLLPPLFQAVADAVMELVPYLPTLIELFIELAQEVLPKLIEGLILVLPQVTQFVIACIDLLDALAPLIPLVGAFASAMSVDLAGRIGGIATAVQGLADMVRGVVDLVAGIFTGDWSRAWEGAKGIVVGQVEIIRGAVQAVLGGAVVTLVKQAGSAVLGAIQQAWTSVVTTVTTAVARVLTSARDGFNQAKQAVTQAMEAAKTAVSNAMDRIKTAVSNGVDRVKQVFRDLPGQIKSALGNLGSLLYNAGSELVQGLINGISSRIGAVRDKMSELASAVRGFFPGSPVKWGPLTSWNNGGAGKRLVSMLADGLSQTGPVDKALSHLSSSVAGAELGFNAGLTASLSGLDAALDTHEQPESKTMNITYVAAENHSLAEEDLFDALDRTRVVGW